MQSFLRLRAFTIVELMIVITILAILGTVGFLSYTTYISNANDFKRSSDLVLIKSHLEIYKRSHSSLYPIPQTYTMIMTGSTLVAYESSFDPYLSSLVGIVEPPLDPKLKTPYLYSVKADRSSYQLSATLENGDNLVAYVPVDHAYADSRPVALVVGNYIPTNKSVIPGLLYVTDSGALFTPGNPSVYDLSVGSNVTTAILNGQSFNLPYTTDGTMRSDPVDMSTLLSGTKITDSSTTSGALVGPWLSCTGIYSPATVYNNGDNEVWPQMNGTTIGSQIGWKYKTCTSGSWSPNSNSGATEDWSYGCATIPHAVYNTGCVWSGCASGFVPMDGSVGCVSPSPVSGACTGLPANTSYYGGVTSYSLTDAPAGTSLTASHNATPATNTCQYNCNIGYGWDGSACVAATISGACSGLPSHALYYGSVTSYSLSGAPFGTSLTGSYASTPSTNTCEFNCTSGYAWDGSSCTSTTVSGACTGLPANTSYYSGVTSYSLTDAPAGTSLTASHNATPATNTCQYNCNIGYGWDGSACIVTSVNGACSGLPSHALYYGSVTSYSLSGASVGTSLTGSYTDPPIANTCEFNCLTGYSWNGSACAAITVNGDCTGLPAGSAYYGGAGSYTLTDAPYGTSLTGSYDATPLANTCLYSCASGYYRSGSSCIAYVNGSCSGLPTWGAYYGGAGSYTLTDAPYGTSLSAGYNATPTVNTCEYSCTSGYTWNGSGCIVAVSAYSPSTTYTTGQQFTWNGATVTVSNTGIGTSDTTFTGCDTPDIAIWEGGTNNVQIWPACNMGSTIAGTTASSYGGLYQWGNNGDISSASTSSSQVDTSSNGPGNYYNDSTTFIARGDDWSSLQNDNLWGSTTGTNASQRWPCAVGYHIPSSGTNDNTTEWGMLYAIFSSSTTFGSCTGGGIYDRAVCALKMPFAGLRDTSGSMSGQGVHAWYWTSSPSGTQALYAVPYNGGSNANVGARTYGFSLRCIRN